MRVCVLSLSVAIVLCGSAAADTIELKSGDKIEGTIVEQSEDTVVVEHAVLGRLEIPASEIKPPAPPKPGVFGTSILEGWDKSLSAGLQGSSGKSKDQSANADFTLKRETERNRMSYVARYYMVSTEDDSTDQFNTRYVHDFLIPDADWFPFLSPFYTYDTDQDWNHRLGTDAGLGYQLIEDETWNVLGRLGGAVARTFTDDRADRDVGEDPLRTEWMGLIALELGWKITDGMTLDWDTVYTPDFADLPNYRLESRAEWKVAIGYVEGLGFKLGGSYIYDAHESDNSRNDRKYYANIVYDF
jgi:putative salt-induced outer membrane protein YdiY